MLPCASRRSTRGLAGVAKGFWDDAERFAGVGFAFRFVGFCFALRRGFAVPRVFVALPARFFTTMTRPLQISATAWPEGHAAIHSV